MKTRYNSAVITIGDINHRAAFGAHQLGGTDILKSRYEISHWSMKSFINKCMLSFKATSLAVASVRLALQIAIFFRKYMRTIPK